MAYGFKYKVTVDNTKVSGSSNLSNFPMLFSGTYDGTGGEPDLRTTGNGGDIENTDSSGGADGATTVPADFEFFSDEALTTPLDFEVEDYTASTGEIHAWVEIPTLSHDTDTVIYLAYGDSGVTTSQEDVNGTWNTNYEAVWHLNTHFNDSTINSYDGTNSGSDDATGKIAQGRDFVRTSSDYIDINSDVGIDYTTGTWSVSGWFNVDDLTDESTIIGWGSGDVDNFGYWMVVVNTDGALEFRCFSGTGGGDGRLVSTASSVVSVDTWYFFTVDFDGGSLDIYVDDASAVSGTVGIDDRTDTWDEVRIGFPTWTSQGAYADGTFDEIRIKSAVTGSDWRTTEYNSQNSPSTFYTISDLATGISSIRQLVGHGAGNRG